MQRYFSIDKKDNILYLNDEDLYHIRIVMRMHDKDEIIVVNENIPYLCSIESNNTALIIKKLEINNDKMPYIRLIIPLLKEQKMDLVLQKATELGVSEIVLYDAIRSIIRINEKEDRKKIRWQKIIKEASEQSHRNNIPLLTGVLKLNELEKLNGLKIFCSTTEKEKSVKKILNLYSTCDTINIVVGPEGGLDPKEEEMLNKMGYESVSCGNRIMRVETVPLFLLSIFNYVYME